MVHEMIEVTYRQTNLPEEKRHSALFVLAISLVVSTLSLAADDSERDTSVFDKHPECTERSEETASNPKCTPQDGPPNRKGVAMRNQGDSDPSRQSPLDGSAPIGR